MAPWVKLMMRRTEKISVYPSAKIAYTLPIASPFRTCCSSRVRVTLLLHEDERPLGAVGLHLDLRHVGLLLYDLATHPRSRRERDLAQRRVVRARDDLLVQRHAQRGEVHLGDRRLLVEGGQRLHEHLDAGERLRAELGRILLL